MAVTLTQIREYRAQQRKAAEAEQALVLGEANRIKAEQALNRAAEEARVALHAPEVSDDRLLRLILDRDAARAALNNVIAALSTARAKHVAEQEKLQKLLEGLS